MNPGVGWKSHNRFAAERTAGFCPATNAVSSRIAVSHGLDGHSHELPYDQLILALGTGTNFFNLPCVEDCCITPKGAERGIN
jgi:NADH dehydrogenase FAD-containing subunit